MFENMMDTIGFVQGYDPELGACMERELERQRQNIELIASENIVSPAVMAAMGSVLTNKYAEGFPGKRYYGGCQFVDQVEQLAIDRACKLFGAKYANVQPHSGAQANLAVYFALLEVGDTVMGMDLSQGGHLTHGSPVNMSGKNYNFVSYGINEEGRIDYEALAKQVAKVRPKMLVAGASAYPRALDFEKLAGLDWETLSDLSVVIVTRGHVADLVCLRETLRHETAYVGMIGSHKKNAAVFDKLRAEGVTEAQLARVHAPIGLPIGAETPEEIAVCIAAEWIADRRTSANSQFTAGMLDALAAGCGGVMATVVRKTGSAPRGVGARLLVQANGHVLGTIGGGLAEREVIDRARAMLDAPRTELCHIDMNNGEAGKSGLICGGSVDVLFEVVD